MWDSNYNQLQENDTLKIEKMKNFAANYFYNLYLGCIRYGEDVRK